MKLFKLPEIKEALESINVISAIEEGFIASSNGMAITPPIGEMIFSNPPGEVHIKHGYIQRDDYYVVKIASGFPENQKLNLAPGNGLMVLFDKKTGCPLALLLDEGYLTNIRTAAAGAIAAKYLAPKHVHRIGIIGNGVQARLQLLYLKKVINCQEVVVFGRNKSKLLQYKIDMESEGFFVDIAKSIEELTLTCNLITTTTASTQPIIAAHHICPNTHITAIGADTSYKQELDGSILSKADIIVTDNITQSIERGNIAHALKDGVIQSSSLSELGNIITGKSLGRTSEKQLTVADFTGISIQDLQIAKAVYQWSLSC